MKAFINNKESSKLFEQEAALTTNWGSSVNIVRS